MKKHLLTVLFFIATTAIYAQGSFFYGMTNAGGEYGFGTIFMVDSIGNLTTLHHFSNVNDGQNPYGDLLQVSDSLLYGMTERSSSYPGTIFEYNLARGKENVVYNFQLSQSTTEGYGPYGSLVTNFYNNGALYGTTAYGSITSGGTIFSFDLSLNSEHPLYDFGTNSDSDGLQPNGSLFQADDGLFYGLTLGGGSITELGPMGTLFSFDSFSGTETVLHRFNYFTDGGGPLYGSVIEATNGLLYGMTYQGGVNGVGFYGGTIFSYDIYADTFSVGHSFGAGTDGAEPFGSLIQVGDSLLYGMTEQGGTVQDQQEINGGTIFSYNIYTHKEKVLHSFGAAGDGAGPTGSLLLASNGLLYGMTEVGGANDLGTVFSYNITTATETVLYSFTGADGENPYGSLIQATNAVISVIPNATYYCSGAGARLTATGATSYTWAPAAGLSATTGSNVTAMPAITTTYLVTGTTSNQVGYTTIVVTVGSPILSVNSTPASVCAGNPTIVIASGGDSYTWMPSTALSATTGDTVTASPTITTTYFVTGTVNGCSAIDTITVTVNPIPIITSLSAPYSYCPGGSSTLTASGGNTYTWLPSTALSTTTGDTVTANPTATTTYTVTGVSSLGCSAMDTVSVTVNPNPVLTVSAMPDTVCSGDSALLVVSGATTYLWSPSMGLSTSTGDSVKASPLLTTTYYVTGMSVSGCSTTDTLPLSVQTCTSVSQLSVTNNQLSIYPNPTSNQLTVETGQLTINEIKITNVLGQTVLMTAVPPSPFLNGEGQGVRLEVSNLPDGLYFIAAKTATGVVTDKLIINR